MTGTHRVELHRGTSAAVVGLIASLLLAPLAGWQFGLPGIAAVALFAATVMASFWLANWFAANWFSAWDATAGLLALTGIRMALPLAVAVVVVIQHDRLIPVPAAVYLVPIYLAMLAAELLHPWRCRPRLGDPTVGMSRSVGSTNRGQG
jgi:hypothetical protein